jgi:hypothetical protein
MGLPYLLFFEIFLAPTVQLGFVIIFIFWVFLAPTTQPRTFFLYFLKTIWGRGGGLLCDVGTLIIILKSRAFLFLIFLIL